jgi:hypothetical protein
MSTLSASDRQVVESLFANPRATHLRPDEFRYRLTRWTDKGQESLDVPERRVPRGGDIRCRGLPSLKDREPRAGATYRSRISSVPPSTCISKWRSDTI